MRLLVQMLLLIVSVLSLSSCKEKNYPSIAEGVSIAATVNIKDMTISFLDIEEQKIIADWKLEKPYIGALILPDGDSILLYGKQVETADLYSLKKGSLITSWKTGKGIVNGMVLETNGEVALVDQKQNTIRFFDIFGLEEGRVTTGQNPLTILEAKKSHMLYVLSFNKEQLTVIDIKTKEKLAGFSIHPSAAGAWINENTGEIWIGGHGRGADIEQNIHVYHLETGTLVNKISAPFMPINFLGINNQVFVLSHGSSSLYKLNDEGKVLDSVIVGSNPFEMIYTDNYLLVAGYDSDDIHLVNPKSLEIVKSIPVGSGPFHIVLRERK